VRNIGKAGSKWEGEDFILEESGEEYWKAGGSGRVKTVF
jgi:hypothetical protein